ncbi:MAG TPA: cation diffusion facilitator family transporter [Acidimicrobiia bacterium]
MERHTHLHPGHGTPELGARDADRRRALWVALGLNGAFLVVQVVAALAFGSLALLADGVHMVSDVVALAIALIAQRVATAAPSPRHTYGLVRAEVIGAQVNAVLLLGAAVWIAVEAVQRLGETPEIDGAGVAVVAAIGLVVNAGSAWVIARAAGASLNLRGAFWHLTGDALGSLGALVAGLAVVVADAVWVDAVASLFIAALITLSAVVLLRDVGRVLLEGAPAGLRVDDVERALAASPQVEAVHHVHVWSLGSEMPALSAHVVLAGEPSLHEAQARGDELKTMLAERFGIGHATLELECHDCVDGHEASSAG